jgi:hypothetical protein
MRIKKEFRTILNNCFVNKAHEWRLSSANEESPVRVDDRL